MDERSQSVLADLFARWNQHAPRYGDVVYSSALQNNGGVWQNVATVVVPSSKSAVLEGDLRVDYGHLLIIRGRLSLAEAKTTLEEVISHSQLRLPDAPAVKLSASIHDTMVRRHGSHDKRFPVEFCS